MNVNAAIRKARDENRLVPRDGRWSFIYSDRGTLFEAPPAHYAQAQMLNRWNRVFYAVEAVIGHDAAERAAMADQDAGCPGRWEAAVRRAVKREGAGA